MISRPKISVITPLHNSVRFIQATLDSLLCQTYTNWESILVDDGSTDNTAQAVKPYLKDKRFAYIRQNNQGIARARNAAIKRASGELVCLLDHDDRWLPTKLEKQVQYAFKHNCEIVCTDAFIVERASRWVYSDLFLEPPSKLEQGLRDSSIDVFELLIRQNFLCTCSVMIARSVFDKYGSFDPAAVPADDYDMWLRCMPETRVGFINEPLVEYLRHEDNFSKNEFRMLEKIVYVLEKNSRKHADNKKRSHQFEASLNLNTELLLRKLIDARAYKSILRHALSLLRRGRPGCHVLYHIFVAPILLRVRNSIRYRLRFIRL